MAKTCANTQRDGVFKTTRRSSQSRFKMENPETNLPTFSSRCFFAVDTEILDVFTFWELSFYSFFLNVK